nr:MAG TPA: hypothetical protein [Caudoviricetes sp.]DAS89262.1 MAG TPA: hypothetical protein [Caudoviricetes sp.]
MGYTLGRHRCRHRLGREPQGEVGSVGEERA